jgi:hypothetical protein
MIVPAAANNENNLIAVNEVKNGEHTMGIITLSGEVKL